MFAARVTPAPVVIGELLDEAPPSEGDVRIDIERGGRDGRDPSADVERQRIALANLIRRRRRPGHTTGRERCDAECQRSSGYLTITACEHPRFSHGRVAYRIEALPEDEDDRQSSIGWAGIAVTNWREAVEAADAPPPGPPDENGVRWLPD
jgi:hypothetical protein